MCVFNFVTVLSFIVSSGFVNSGTIFCLEILVFEILDYVSSGTLILLTDTLILDACLKGRTKLVTYLIQTLSKSRLHSVCSLFASDS